MRKRALFVITTKSGPVGICMFWFGLVWRKGKDRIFDQLCKQEIRLFGIFFFQQPANSNSIWHIVIVCNRLAQICRYINHPLYNCSFTSIKFGNFGQINSDFPITVPCNLLGLLYIIAMYDNVLSVISYTYIYLSQLKHFWQIWLFC